MRKYRDTSKCANSCSLSLRLMLTNNVVHTFSVPGIFGYSGYAFQTENFWSLVTDVWFSKQDTLTSLTVRLTGFSIF